MLKVAMAMPNNETIKQAMMTGMSLALVLVCNTPQKHCE